MPHYYDDREKFMNCSRKAIMQSDVVLDIGPGIQPQEFIAPVTHICCEPYSEYADILTRKNTLAKQILVLKINWKQAMEIFPDSSVDTVMALDVIEHLEKMEAVELLKLTEKKARKQVIIFTPLWFMPQEVPEGMKDAWGLSGAEWQRHKSGWTPEDFWDGWEVHVCPEFHYSDAITGIKFEKPYWALFAIYTKNGSRHTIYTNLRRFVSFFTITLPLYFKANSFLYNPILKFGYRKIIRLLKKSAH